MNRTIGIVGGGLMGCLAALTFSRRGDRVVLFERRDRVMAGASAGNEGKLHHGFTYGLDRSGDTRRLMFDYGSRFLPALERLFARKLDRLILHRRQYYVLHRDSALGRAQAEAHMAETAALRRSSAHADDSPAIVARLAPAEVSRLFSESVTAAWDVAEPSLDCPALVSLVTGAIAGDDAIELRTSTRVGAIDDENGRPHIVDMSGRTLGTFDLIVNAAWEGLPALERRDEVSIDGMCLRAKAGFIAPVTRGLPDRPVTFVYGSFGDLVPLRDGNAYLSWYPSCLMGFSPDADDGCDWYDHAVDAFDFETAYARSCAAFAELMPGIAFADKAAGRRCGPILAHARSDITDPQSGLHKRTGLGIAQRGRVFTVNTGKLTCAPGLAEELDVLAR